MYSHSTMLNNELGSQQLRHGHPTVQQQRNGSREESDVLYIDTTSADLDMASPSLFLTDSLLDDDMEDPRHSSHGPRRTPPFFRPRGMGRLPNALAPRTGERFHESPFVVVQESRSASSHSSFDPPHIEEWAFYNDNPQEEPLQFGSNDAIPGASGSTGTLLRPRPLRHIPIQWD